MTREEHREAYAEHSKRAARAMAAAVTMTHLVANTDGETLVAAKGLREAFEVATEEMTAASAHLALAMFLEVVE